MLTGARTQQAGCSLLHCNQFQLFQFSYLYCSFCCCLVLCVINNYNNIVYILYLMGHKLYMWDYLKKFIKQLGQLFNISYLNFCFHTGWWVQKIFIHQKGTFVRFDTTNTICSATTHTSSNISGRIYLGTISDITAKSSKSIGVGLVALCSV